MLFFRHPPPPCRKAVAVQMVQQRANQMPNVRTIVVDTPAPVPAPLKRTDDKA